MNKGVKAGLDIAKGSIVLTAWATKIVAVGTLKGVYHSSKAVHTVYRRYQVGKKVERRK